MIKVYSSSSWTSCRKAKAWLKEQGLEIEERNIISEPLNEEEIKRILCLTEFGTDEIISTRSKVYEKLALDFNELSLSELVAIIVKHPSLLRRPIITDGKKLQIGYNEEDIHQFIPREVRKMTSLRMTEQLLYMDLKNQQFAWLCWGEEFFTALNNKKLIQSLRKENWMSFFTCDGSNNQKLLERQ